MAPLEKAGKLMCSLECHLGSGCPVVVVLYCLLKSVYSPGAEQEAFEGICDHRIPPCLVCLSVLRFVHWRLIFHMHLSQSEYQIVFREWLLPLLCTHTDRVCKQAN